MHAHKKGKWASSQMPNLEHEQLGKTLALYPDASIPRAGAHHVAGAKYSGAEV